MIITYKSLGATNIQDDDIVEEKYEALQELLKNHGYSLESFEDLEVEIEGSPTPGYPGGWEEPPEPPMIEDLTVLVMSQAKENLEKIKKLKTRQNNLSKMKKDLNVRESFNKATRTIQKEIDKLQWVDITDYIKESFIRNIEEKILESYGDYDRGDL
jgi:hypothetical protein